jgi:dienelactone hydrolase
MKIFALLLSSALFTFAGTEVKYPMGDITSHGYLALPEGVSAEAPVPGVIVVPEWWGNNDYAKSRADMLADLGYAALAIDMYGEGKTTTEPQQAGAWAQEATADLETMTTRFMAGMELLQQQEEVRSDKVAAIGYCFGGRVVTQMGLLNTSELAGIGSFHGSLNDLQFPKGSDDIDTQLLVCHGAQDDFISADDLSTFMTETVAHNADLTFISYPDAVHAFTNPAATKIGEELDLGIAYNKDADEKSWAALERFLASLFASS